MSTIPRYPLTWPTGWPRTPWNHKRPSPFKTTDTKAQNFLFDEIRRLGGRDVILSSNLKLRNDGYPYANQPRCDDEGIAVYFKRRGKDYVFACDTFHRRDANMHAIAKTIEALRGIERWGASDMLERAFTGFTALPPPFDWRTVLGFVPSDTPTLDEVERHYKDLIHGVHPDQGGDHDAFVDLNLARDAARKELTQ